MNKQHQMVSATIFESADILELFNTNELTLCQNVKSMSRTFCDYVFTLVKSHIRDVFCDHQTFLIKIMTTLLRLLTVGIYTIITCL
jgi:hypothetical protein